ncbi:hypothetical protein BGM25_03545 [Bacillus sp. FJAT-29953]|nr:hypothetical protein [Bacillus sp. FJAT-29953]
MLITRYDYRCGCGWNGEWVSGGTSRERTLLEKVEHQLLAANHQNTKAVWRQLYQSIIMGEITAEQVKTRSGFLVCCRCQSGFEQLTFHDSVHNQPLHSFLCKDCGNPGEIRFQPDWVPCPVCSRPVAKGQPLSSRELLVQMLGRCKVTLAGGHSEEMFISIGNRNHLQPIFNNSPFSSVFLEKGDCGGENLLERLATCTKAVLHTGFDSQFESNLALELLKETRLLGVDVVTIMATPPFFEGRKRLDLAFATIKELQAYSHTILVSGSALEKQYGPSVELYRKHIPNEIYKVCYLFFQKR